MPSDIAISVEGLSKRYLLGHNTKQEAHPTLRDQIARGVRDLARKTRDMASGRAIVQGDTVEEFWALRDVSFEIPRGARVGILGRNGAGKSTLLKLLSRITEPTSGRIKINGRVASLLEVGTGFHPELTGRENIYLNGAILGMSRREIQNKFDEIVEFAEVARFLDTPVKRYSSGMYVRLAFGVAAHLEPEILIVDEVLAVGDAQFQKKCLGKMDDVAKNGRTVIFVSHNMAAIGQLCETGVLLESGNVSFVGVAQSAISHYLASGQDRSNPVDLRNRAGRKGDGQITFERLCMQDASGVACAQFSIGDSLFLRIGLGASIHLRGRSLSVEIRTDDGVALCNIVNADSGVELRGEPGAHAITVALEDLRFYPGSYQISIWVGSSNGRETHDHVESAVQFEIVDGGKLTSRSLPRSTGLLLLTPRWTVSPEVANLNLVARVPS